MRIERSSGRTDEQAGICVFFAMALNETKKKAFFLRLEILTT